MSDAVNISMAPTSYLVEERGYDASTPEAGKRQAPFSEIASSLFDGLATFPLGPP
jgi:hypothetical protein